MHEHGLDDQRFERDVDGSDPIFVQRFPERLVEELAQIPDAKLQDVLAEWNALCSSPTAIDDLVELRRLAVSASARRARMFAWLHHATLR